jgi:hypothetical protein
MDQPRNKRTTPLERALLRAQREAEQYEREQEEYLRNGHDHQEPFRELMYQAGRTDSRRKQ